MCLNPVKKCKLILSKLFKYLRLLVSCSKLLPHICGNIRYSGISGVMIETLKKVKLGILFDLRSQMI